ncbi:alpha/beta hydrolase fold protein [Kribbella flavida DSM 17836]|uniref:Alpha/beta hydrolase fold protein n=1 Tax=Kribbella flavida (strain DSM 17836 / JCM 10339 / NBRC 14399) TaxID=479435 RepID=D2PLV9_KRIFD|nr:alpha/beta hydrolase [Kribbella flavida]ADB32539.1 alpha/beta hydrolase fold protein [Kribbella flavida DSM 17836]
MVVAVGQYVEAGGVLTYFEVEGAGDPVLLLHGGGVGGDTWLAQVAALSRHYTVIVPERRGHGRTPDVDGPVTMELLAADLAAFIDRLEIAPAHVIGWSDGGKVGAWLALARPELVRKLVLISAELTRAGQTPATEQLMTPEGLQDLAEALRPEYEPVAPDGPGHFPVVFAKWAEMWRTMPDFDLADLKKLTMPVLVMQGDDDGVRLEHSVTVAKALPDAQLAVVPGASHGLTLEKPGLVNQLLLDFLADEQQPKLIPGGALDS